MDLGLADKVVVVTGASRGIGRAIAQAFAAEGARVAALSRTADDLARTVDMLEGEAGAHLAVTCDVTDPGQAVSALDRVRSELGASMSWSTTPADARTSAGSTPWSWRSGAWRSRPTCPRSSTWRERRCPR